METRTTEDARRHLGEVVREAAANGTVTVISVHGIPAAAVVPLSMVPADAEDPDGPH